MSESLSIDSPFRGWAMPKSYSGDLRERAIEVVEMEGASRREAAELLGVSVASTVRWLQRWHDSGSAEPRPRGGSVSPLEKFAAQVLGLVARNCAGGGYEPAAVRCGVFSTGTTSPSKKSLQAAERERADVARARRRWIREQGMLDPARLVFIDESVLQRNGRSST